MFNRKSSYALNKKDPNAIVYMDANDTIIRLTRKDFASEEEFLKWKSLSDEDYHASEKEAHVYANHTLALDELSEEAASIPAVDVCMEQAYDRAEEIHRSVRKVTQIRKHLTDTQFRRVWMYFVDGMTVDEIGPAKGGLHHAHYPGRVANRMDLLKWTSRAAAPVFAIMLYGSNSARAAASQSQIPCADWLSRQRIHVTLRKPTKPRKEIAMMQPTSNESRIHTDELVDIREVSVDKNLPKEERIAAFIRQIKNPYRFRCGDFVVNACFAGNSVTLEECLQGILR